jgi:hypothetical protein
MLNQENLIRNYIDGYNSFDIDKMVLDFDEDIVFKNISNGETNMVLTGLAAFKKQAEQAKTYFSKRTQTITSFNHTGNETEIEIDYHAILNMDFPNGLKKGEELKMKGKSIFQFSGYKIVSLTDIS